jgi:hypothetical protein
MFTVLEIFAGVFAVNGTVCDDAEDGVPFKVIAKEAFVFAL